MGALIEGAALPAAEEQVRLQRGSLAVAGEVVWCRSGQAGLRFLSRVNVKEWLPMGANRVAQQHVDELLQHCRAGAGPSSLAPTFDTADVHPAGAAELARLAAALEALADDLADDAAVVGRHSSKLQTLDIAAQVLRKLSAGRP